MDDDGSGTGVLSRADDVAATAVLGLRMMTADLAANPATRDHGARTEAREIAVDDLVERLSTPAEEAAAWRHDLARRLAAAPTSAARAAELDRAGRDVAASVTTRARQLVVLVELATLEPWPAGVTWAGTARLRALEDIVDEFDHVGRAVLADVERERALLLRHLRAGGPSRGPWGRIAAGALRIALHTRFVLLDERADRDAARRVALLLRRRLDEVVVRLIDIATRLIDPDGVDADLRSRLERERAGAELAESALEAALTRLHELGVDPGDRRAH